MQPLNKNTRVLLSQPETFFILPAIRVSARSETTEMVGSSRTAVQGSPQTLSSKTTAMVNITNSTHLQSLTCLRDTRRMEKKLIQENHLSGSRNSNFMTLESQPASPSPCDKSCPPSRQLRRWAPSSPVPLQPWQAPELFFAYSAPVCPGSLPPLSPQPWRRGRGH